MYVEKKRKADREIIFTCVRYITIAHLILMSVTICCHLN